MHKKEQVVIYLDGILIHTDNWYPCLGAPYYRSHNVGVHE